MDFTFLFNTLFRKKWVIIACTLAGILAALFFVLAKKKLYLSAAQYATGFTMKQAVKTRDDEGLNIFEVDQRFNNVIETFRSPVVIGMLSYDLMLHDLEEEKHSFRVLTEKELKSPAYTKVDKQKAKLLLLRKHDSLTILKAYDPEEEKVYELVKLYGYNNEAILHTLTVDRIPGTDFLNILFRSENPELSAFVVNTIGKEFSRFFNSINNVQSGQSEAKPDSMAARKKRGVKSKLEEARRFKAGFGTLPVSDTPGAIEKGKDFSETEYQTLKSKLATSQDVGVSPGINFKQTLIGQPAIKPEPGNSKLILAITAIASFMISAFMIILMDFLDTSLRAPSIFQRVARLKLLTAVNYIDLKGSKMSRYFNLAEGERLNTENLFIENMRKLRFEIESSGKKIFLFTSTKPGEGKTTIIEALANSFSLSKKKVLVIDTNFSNNTLTEKFKARPLLDQFSLNGEKNVMEKFESIKTLTDIPYTDVVGCKEGNFSPSEILPEKNLLENLSTVAAQYDYVFLEGAALNDHADSKELLKYVDGIVPVFSARSVIKENDKESIHFLRAHKEKLVGAILNMVDKDNIAL